MKKLKIGLALGGGGARGFAHIGVLRALEEASLTIHSLAGISMGAVIGAGYAHKTDLKRLEKYVLDFKYLEFVNGHNKEISMDIKKVIKYFDEYLGNCDFKDLEIPLKILTTDLKNMCSFVIQKGKVSIAIAASCTTPYIHKPVQYEGHTLVDGGLISDIPIELVDNQNIDIVIGVNTASVTKVNENDELYLNNFQKGIISRFPSLSILWNSQINSYKKHSKRIVNNELANLRMAMLKKPLIIIKPEMNDINVLSFDRAEEIIEIGYLATKKVIKQLSNNYSFKTEGRVSQRITSVNI